MFRLTDHVTTDLYEASYKIKRDYRNYLNLASNELNHRGLESLLQKFYTHYLPTNASHYPYYDEMRAELTKFLGISPGSLLLSPGSDSAIAMLLTLFAKKHNSLILQAPNYYNYEYYAKIHGINISAINFLGKSSSAFVEEICLQVQTAKPSLVVLTNPDPYEGRLLTLDNIEMILETCTNHNHLVVIDETYTKFSGVSHLNLLHHYQNVIILHTLSKAYGAAGFRLAFIISSPEIVRLIFKSGLEYGVNIYALAFAKFIMDHQMELDAIKEDIIGNRSYFEDICRKELPLWSVIPSSSIFVSLDLHSDEYAKMLVSELEERKIIVRNLNQFDPQLQGKVRMCMSDKITLNRLLSELYNLYPKITQ